MQLKDPKAHCYEVFLGEDRTARLFDPEWAEMFWCSYRVVPINPEWDERLRSEDIWNECLISIKARDGTIPNPHTFAGGASFKAFCLRETDRIDFRSLWPTEDMLLLPVKPKSALSRAIDWVLRRSA